MNTKSSPTSLDPLGDREPADQDQLQQATISLEVESQAIAPAVTSESGFQTLPEGALVGNETYYITSIRSEGPDYNLYSVEETCAVLPCPNQECGYLENPASEQECIACGTPLNSVIPVHRRHQLREYRDFSNVAAVAHLSELGLSHPGLLLHHYFAERPYGNQDRYYLVMPDPLPVLASKVSPPQKISRVLDWGHQLADALAYLHTHHLWWQEVNLDKIALRERHAMWLDLNAVQALSSDSAEAKNQQTQNVATLARAMFYLAAGKDTYQSQADLPEAAIGVFERVLGTQAEIVTAEGLAEAFRKAVVAIRRPTTLRLRVGRHTDVGMVRDLNEDSLLVLDLDRVHRSINRPIGLYVVADGMGGHAAGDVASGLVINTIAEKMATHLLVPELSSDTNNEAFDAQLWLADAVQAANLAVYNYRQSAKTNMGTTLVATLVIGDMAYIANVGDSRAYLITSAGSIRQITTDHSLVERLIAMGQIKPDEARIHPQRNVIYRTIGENKEAEIDFFTQKLSPGDSLLLCSDGLSGKVEDTQISRLVDNSRSPQEACELLVQTANANGGDDNITAIIVQASIS